MVKINHTCKTCLRTIVFIAALLVLHGFNNFGWGQTNTWDGSSSNNWNTAANWSLNAVPTAAHDVIIDINATILVDVSRTINSLTISNNTSVSFTSSGGGRVITIDNTGSSIGAGSSLMLQGSTGSGTRSMSIVFTGTNRTMDIAGSMTLTSVGEGTIYNAANSLTTVTGTLKNDGSGGGTSGIITSTASNLTFSSGGNYQHALNAGTIPTATWNVNSKCTITGVTTTIPGGLSQNFGNFIYNCPAQTEIENLSVTQINGDLVINSTGSSQLQLNTTPLAVANYYQTGGNFSIASGTARTLSINGIFSIVNGTFYLSSGNGIGTLNVTGNMDISGTSFIEFGTGTAIPYNGIINLYGNVSIGTGSLLDCAGNGSGLIIFKKAGIQTFSNEGTIQWVEYLIEANSELQLLSDFPLYSNWGYGTDLTVNGTIDLGTYNVNQTGPETSSTFTLNALGSLKTANPNGITINSTSGSIQVGGPRTYNIAANYTYYSSSSQFTGDGLTGANNLTINNNAGVILSNAVSVSGSLNFVNGILTTTSTNLLSTTNSTTTAISGGSNTSFINGPVKWTLPASLSSGSTYIFPVGKGTTYLPFVLINPTTGTGTITTQVEAFTANSGGTTDATLISKSTSEYWSLVTSGNFTNSSISLTRQTAVIPFNAIGGSSTIVGTYTSLAGTAGTNSVSNSDEINANRFFVFAAKRTIITGAISGSPFCAGASVSIPFTITGTFNSGNTFTAQLSDESGSFASPVSIGTLTQSTAGTISGVIPTGAVTGSGYRIRVVSSNPIVTGTDNGTNLIINSRPTVPVVGTITQPTCSLATGSFVLSGLPSVGTWTLTRTPGGTTTTGTGTSTTISGLATGTYIYSVTNASGCTSVSTGNVVINAQPATPSAPIVGTITQPTCSSATGSVVLSGLPSVGPWTLTRNPGGTTATGTGTTTTISGLAVGTYTYTITNASGCTSVSSGNIVINTQPVIPTITGTFPGSRCGTGPVTLSATTSAGTINWYSTLTGGSSLGTGTTFITPSISATTTYYVDATNGGCTSTPRISVLASINASSSITAGGGGTYCTGSTITLTSSGTNISNQYWQGPNNFYSVEQNPVVSTSATAGMSGIYTVTGSSLNGVNLVTNGDFEAGNIGFTSSYTASTDLVPEGTYAVVANPQSVHGSFINCVDHTASPGTLQMVINGAITAGVTVWSQSTTVATGTDYQFSYWVQSVVAGNPSQLQLYVNGIPAGPVYTALYPTCQWIQFIYNWNSGSSTTAILSLKNQNIVAGGNDFSLDDIEFHQVCQAASVVYKSGDNVNQIDNLASSSVAITVNAPVTAGSIGNAQSICRGYTPATLTSTAVGTGTGTITYEWQTNASGSFVTIAGATDATYAPPALSATTIYQRRTVATSGGATCYSPYTPAITITVTGPLVSSGGPITVCQSASPTAIILSSASYSGSGATGAAWSIISGGGILSSTANTTNPAAVTYTPAANYSGTVTLRLTTAGGSCNAIAERIITISPLPAATILYSGSPFCISESNPQNVTLIGTSGGTYSASPAGLAINTANGAITPSASTAGNYTVTYTILASGGCGLFTTSTAVTILRDQVWTGIINTDWNTSGNWYCGLIPDLTTNVQIPNVANKPILSSGTTGKAKNIVIEIGSSLTVVGNTMQIAGTITNSGTFTAAAGTIEMKGSSSQDIGAGIFEGNTILNLNINNSAGVTLQGPLNITGSVVALNGNLSSAGNLTLVSSPTQTALIDGTGTGQVLGNVTMQRYLPSGYGYKYVSSPFQAATVSELSDDLMLTASFPSFYKYDEDNHRDSSGILIYSTGWVNYTAGSAPLVPMKGYAGNFGNVAAPKTIDLTGVVNNNITATENLFNHARKYTKGFNLVGNPYPSPVDWDATSGWTKININNAIYYFDAGTSSEYTGTYSTYIGGVSSNGIAGRIIPSMQGFFVHVTDGTTGTFGMNNQVRVNNLSPAYHKSVSDNFRPMVRLSASYENEKNCDAAVVYFNELATAEFDSEFDALKLMNTDVSVPNLYALTPLLERTSISAIPYPSDNITRTPLGMKTEKDTWVMLAASDIENIPGGIRVYLSDEANGLIQDLLMNPEYRVNLEKGTFENRFALLFSEKELVNVPKNTDTFYANLQNGKLTIFAELAEGNEAQLVISNMLGQVMGKSTIYGDGSHEIDQHLPTGMYLLTMYTQKGICSKKIFIPN